MSHQRGVHAFSCVSNGVTRAGAATGLGDPGHNGPVSSCSRSLVKLQCTKQDVALLPCETTGKECGFVDHGLVP
jgi:hypothetical protein